LNFPIHIARRYLFARKSHNAINIISAVSVAGVTIGTLAFIIVMSVFNGFDEMIKTLYSSFDPDLKISVVAGKSFIPNEATLAKLSKTEGVLLWSKVVEENVLLRYSEKQFIATIKGVDNNYHRINNIDDRIIEGKFMLEDKGAPNAVLGTGVAYYLQVGLTFTTPIVVYLPRKGASASINPESSYNHKYIFPSGIFSIETETDTKFMIVPLRFANELLEDSLSVTAIEVKLNPAVDAATVQSKVQLLFGDKYRVKNRYQQKEAFYRIMKYENWAIFMILCFILIIASFNIIGSLSMLIIEKKKDVSILHSIGADRQLISRIFLYEGMMISFIGAVLGLILGLTVCWLQMRYGLVKLGNNGTFLIDAYPVKVKLADIALVFFTVLGIGYLAAWYPVKLIIRKYLPEK
jgi:lipoprotein-releasing system permease protein